MLGIVLFIVEIVSVTLFLICGQTIFSLLGTMIENGGGNPVDMRQQGNVSIVSFTFTPRNGGLLAARVNLGFGLTLKDGSYSTKNTTSVYLPPGVGKTVILTIKVPQDKLQQYSDANGTINIYTSMYTLNDLVRLDYNALAEGGG